MIKNFFSLQYFSELKVLFILEFIILLLGIMLINTPSAKLFIADNNLSIFNIFAFLFTLLVYSLSCMVDPKKYFNLATLIVTGTFTYGCFWFMLELLSNL